MKIKKITGIGTVVVLSMTILLIGCGNSSTGNVSNQDNSRMESDTAFSIPDDENISSSASAGESSSFSSNVGQESTSSVAGISSSASKPSSPSRNTGNGTSKPSNNGGSSNSGGSSSSNKPSVPLNSSNSGNAGGGADQPAEPEKPAVHTHNWVKEPEGETFDWQGVGPDENGYTTNREKTKVSINMCVTCYEYFGVGDISFDRYWEHSDKTGHGGYCTYPVYAVYDVYFCEECTSYKRGEFSFYGYYDYSDQNNPQWKHLTQEQITELNLP